MPNFLAVAAGCLSHKSDRRKSKIHPRRFLKLFGVPPYCRCHICHLTYLAGTHLHRPELLLYALYFLKHYPRDSVGYTQFRKTSINTYREDVWKVISFLGKEGTMREVEENAEKLDSERDLILVDATELPVAKPANQIMQRTNYLLGL